MMPLATRPEVVWLIVVRPMTTRQKCCTAELNQLVFQRMVPGIEALVGKAAPGAVDCRVIIRQRCCSYFPEYLVCSCSVGLEQTTGLHWGYIAGWPQVQASPLMERVVQEQVVEAQLAAAGLAAPVREFLPVKSWRLPRH